MCGGYRHQIRQPRMDRAREIHKNVSQLDKQKKNILIEFDRLRIILQFSEHEENEQNWKRIRDFDKMRLA